MDELEFRRTIYSDPFSKDPAIKDAAEADPKKRQFLDDMRQLEAQIQAVANVNVPEGLPERLLLRQSMERFRKEKQEKRAYWLAAASVAVAVTFGAFVYQQKDMVLSEHAIAHVYHEPSALITNEALTLSQVNSKMATFGGAFNQDIGNVYYANFCVFDNVKSLHMVIGTDNEKYSVFVVPKKGNQKLEERFGDENYDGTSVKYDNASLIVLGDKGLPLEPIQNKLKQSLDFRI